MRRKLGYITLPDHEAVSREAAERFLCAAVRAKAESGRFNVALPGGSTPRRMMEMLASDYYRDMISWASTHIYFTDERCVPPDHPDSNYGMARGILLDKVPIPEHNIHRFHGEDDPEKAAENYNSEVYATADCGWALDLVVLGVGPDGHTASLFPRSPALEIQDKLFVAVYVDKLDAWRLTMTLSALNSASQIIILATGEEKQSMLKRLVSGGCEPNEFPVAAIRSWSGDTLILTDQPISPLQHFGGSL